MTFEQLLEMANNTKFVMVCDEREYGDNEIRLIIDDFEGFDDNWSEVFRPNAELEEAFKLLEVLKQYGRYDTDDWHDFYYFGEYSFEIAWSSEDI